MPKDWTIAELSELTGMCQENLRVLARSGRLSGMYKIGNVWRMRESAVDAMRGEPTSREAPEEAPQDESGVVIAPVGESP